MILLEKIDAAQQLIQQIRMSSEFQSLDYRPDVTMADCSMGLSLLRWEIEDLSMHPRNAIHIQRLEALAE